MTTEPIRDKKQAAALAQYYKDRGQLRNHVLIVAAMHTALRISDFLRLTWDDVYDFNCRSVRKEIYIVEKKTKKAKTLALNCKVIAAVQLLLPWAGALPGAPIFKSRKTGRAIGRVQATASSAPPPRVPTTWPATRRSTRRIN